MGDKTIFEIVYLDIYGNFIDTNMEYKNKDLGIQAINLNIGNWKKFNTQFIQLYRSVYDINDNRITTTLEYEKEVE